MSASLSAIATSLETAAGASTSANPNEYGYWKRIAAASETLAGATTPTNDNLFGYMKRAAVALESIAGTDGAEENTNEAGYTKRVVDALEVQAGAVTSGSLLSRLVTAAANATFAADGPVNLLTNGTFSSAGPPPTLTAPIGTATLVISGGKLTFTGGSGNGSTLTATWTGLDLQASRTYKIVYEASDQAAACVPTFSLGGSAFTAGSGTTGEQSVEKTNGNLNTNLAIRFSLSSAGRLLSLDNVQLYYMLDALAAEAAGVAENEPVGTVVVTLTNVSTGSTLELTDDAGGMFVLDGLEVKTTAEFDFETTPSFDIEITETLITAYNSPRATPVHIDVLDVPE